MYQKYIIWFIIIVIWLFSSTFAYKELIIQNIDKKPVRVIKVVLDGEHFVVASPAEDGGATLQELIKKVWWDTGINGSYFCPRDYSYCNWVTHTNSERIFLWDWESWSRHRPDTSIRMVFGFDKMGEPLLVQNNLGKIFDYGLRLPLDTINFNKLHFGIGGFPTLLLNWEDKTYAYTVYIDEKMKTAGNKTFICSTKDWSTIYMWVVWGLNIPQMPAFLKKNFGCRNALNLDAWASIGMVYSGFVLDQWWRTRIMDSFVVLDRDQYTKLTGITPPNKTPHSPGEQYQLTQKDQQKVKNIYNALQPFIVQNGSKQKRSFISLLRSAVTAPKIVADPQKHAIIKDLLWRFFVIWEL